MSNKVLPFLFVSLLLNSLFAQKNDEKLVKQSFNNYKSAILNDNGEEAVNFVSDKTISYYSEILEKTKQADSATVNSLNLFDKLMVFSIRHRASKDDILSFDGKGLLKYAIKNGMVGKNSVKNNSIGDVEVEGNFAKGQFLSNGQVTPIKFHFYKEDEVWKIDLTSIFDFSTTAFKKMQMDSGKEENEYLFMLLEMMTGTKPGIEIWNTIEDK